MISLSPSNDTLTLSASDWPLKSMLRWMLGVIIVTVVVEVAIAAHAMTEHTASYTCSHDPNVCTRSEDGQRFDVAHVDVHARRRPNVVAVRVSGDSGWTEICSSGSPGKEQQQIVHQLKAFLADPAAPALTFQCAWLRDESSRTSSGLALLGWGLGAFLALRPPFARRRRTVFDRRAGSAFTPSGEVPFADIQRVEVTPADAAGWRELRLVVASGPAPPLARARAGGADEPALVEAGAKIAKFVGRSDGAPAAT